MKQHVYPIIGHKALADVATADVIAILKPIWAEMPETASRVRGRIQKVYAAWKVESGQQDKSNPAQWAGHLDAVFPRKSKVRPVEHHTALPYAEVPALMARLAKQPGMAALALRFLILTATRTSETLAARWSEVVTEGNNPARWAIPKERMKIARPHTVPLSDAAVAVLDDAARHRVDGNDAIFPGTTMDPRSPHHHEQHEHPRAAAPDEGRGHGARLPFIFPRLVR
jgi:integrase